MCFGSSTSEALNFSSLILSSPSSLIVHGIHNISNHWLNCTSLSHSAIQPFGTIYWTDCIRLTKTSTTAFAHIPAAPAKHDLFSSNRMKHSCHFNRFCKFYSPEAHSAVCDSACTSEYSCATYVRLVWMLFQGYQLPLREPSEQCPLSNDAWSGCDSDMR